MQTSSYDSTQLRAGNRRLKWLISAKALSFALIGVINTVIDYGVFFTVRSLLERSTQLSWQLASLAGWCRCARADDFVLVLANVTAWSIAITGSYFMNALITFATETERKLRWHSYARFVAAGAIGLAASTATLLLCVQALLLPVWLAKLVAVGASFLATFSLAHLVVFKSPSVAARE